ncbi:MAG: alpha/beta hydrolase [Chloroflexota bacterium]|nr:alpha/beta hydrolase [Chloroflexota bacterium]MDQ5864257.1 alpha/beta hydrolase [Chloroflexota bacterium]
MVRDIFSQTPVPAQHRIPYGPGEFHFGDLYLPTNSQFEFPNSKLPVVAFIHGGFWRSQYDLTHAGHAAHALSEAGFATWSIEYRRIGHQGGGWPGTFQDVGAAVDYLRVLAPQYNLDLDRVVVAGHSAGGHLSAWVASRHRIPYDDPLYVENPLPVKAAVPLAGVVDLRRGWELKLSSGVVEDFLGGSPEAVPGRYATASPIELLPTGVPMSLIHGTDDDNVPYEISERYVQAARQRGDDTELVTLQGTGHFEVINPDTEEWQVVVSTILELIEK